MLVNDSFKERTQGKLKGFQSTFSYITSLVFLQPLLPA